MVFFALNKVKKGLIRAVGGPKRTKIVFKRLKDCVECIFCLKKPDLRHLSLMSKKSNICLFIILNEVSFRRSLTATYPGLDV